MRPLKTIRNWFGLNGLVRASRRAVCLAVEALTIDRVTSARRCHHAWKHLAVSPAIPSAAQARFGNRMNRAPASTKMAIARMVTIFMLVCWRGQLSGRICIHGQKTLRSIAISIPTCSSPMLAEPTSNLALSQQFPEGARVNLLTFSSKRRYASRAAER